MAFVYNEIDFYIWRDMIGLVFVVRIGGIAVGIVFVVALIIGLGIGSTAIPRTVTVTSSITTTYTSIATATSILTSIYTSTYTTTVEKTITSVETVTMPTTVFLTHTVLSPTTTTLIETVTSLTTATSTKYVLFTITENIVVSRLDGTYSFGERFRVGDLEYTVLNYTIARYIKSSPQYATCGIKLVGITLVFDYRSTYYYSARPKMKLIVIWIEMKYIGTKPTSLLQPLPQASFYLVTDKRNTYGDTSPCYLTELDTLSPEIVAQAIEYIGPPSLSEPLYPGQSYTITLLFQIPEDENPAILLAEYQGSHFIIPLK